jgi:hypothetical protein
MPAMLLRGDGIGRLGAGFFRARYGYREIGSFRIGCVVGIAAETLQRFPPGCVAAVLRLNKLLEAARYVAPGRSGRSP